MNDKAITQALLPHCHYVNVTPILIGLACEKEQGNHMELSQAITFIQRNAEQHRDKAPTLGTLLEEVAELARSLEGKHEHHATLELIQIGGIVTNMLTRYAWTDADGAIHDRESERQRAAWQDAERGPLKHGGQLFDKHF